MTTEELPEHLRQHWLGIRAKLDKGSYAPSPVKRVEVPKPNGGVRLLGIPTVLDRMIQQAMHQVLSPIFEETFSPHSYGFRPRRSAHDAVKAARDYISEGYEYVVDVDLEKFFDTVHHDRLMARLETVIKDERVLSLIRTYLKAGVMVHGVEEASEEGTPQGGPLSPLLSNIVLTELDRALPARGHRFVRYADDCNVYVKSLKAAERILESMTRFIENRMRLKVNQAKSAAEVASNRIFLGFRFYRGRTGQIQIWISPTSLKRAKSKIRKMTRRNQGQALEMIRDRLNRYLIGWLNYYGLSDIRSQFRDLDRWIRRRMRQLYWKQWKTTRNRIRQLLALGVSEELAIVAGRSSGRGCWFMSHTIALHMGLSNSYWQDFGLKSLPELYDRRLT